MQVPRSLFIGAFLAASLTAGIAAGPHAQALYRRLVSEPPVTTGDFEALYRDSGTRVVLFSTSTCPYCERTRALLARERVAYKDYLTDRSADDRKRFQTLGGDAVPLLFIGERRIVGFDEPAIRAALGALPPVQK